jgi:hypothetical protein
MQPPHNNDEDDLDRKPAAKTSSIRAGTSKEREQSPSMIGGCRSQLSMNAIASINKSTAAPIIREQVANRLSDDTTSNTKATRTLQISESITHKDSVGSFLAQDGQGMHAHRPLEQMLNDGISLPTMKLLEENHDCTQNRHMHALLHLFSSSEYNENRLNEVAKLSGSSGEFLSNSSDLLKLTKESMLAIKMKLVTVDKDLPTKLGNIAMKVRHQSFTMNTLIPDLHSLPEMDSIPDYGSLHLKDLELSTRQCYLNTIQTRDNTLSPNISLSSGARNAAARFFSLKFNGGSLSTISKWSCNNSSNDVASSYESRHNADMAATKDDVSSSRRRLTQAAQSKNKLKNNRTNRHRLKQPTVDKRFRKCFICKRWGHYEIECSDLRHNDIIRFGGELQRGIVKGEDSTDELYDEEPSIVPQRENCIDADQSSNIKCNDVRTNGANDETSAVTTEMFKGFILEQREAPEDFSLIQPARANLISPVPEYDDSFLVDNFCVKAATSLELLMDVESLPISSMLQGSKKERQPDESKQMMSNEKEAHNHEYFREGDVVAWFEKKKSNEQSNTSSSVSAGVVVSYQNGNGNKDGMGWVCVNLLSSIPASPDPNYVYGKPSSSSTDLAVTELEAEDSCNNKPKDPPTADSSLAAGSTMWIEENELFLVTEQANVSNPEELREKKRKYNHRNKRSCSSQELHSKDSNSNTLLASLVEAVNDETCSNSTPKGSKSRSKSYRERFKETGRVLSNDMSLVPRKPARMLVDGTYSMPQGRRPGKHLLFCLLI